MSNDDLIKNHLIFHAYFCHLLQEDQADAAEDLCRMSIELSNEVEARNIDENQIVKYLNSENFNPYEQFLITKYLYPELKKWC